MSTYFKIFISNAPQEQINFENGDSVTRSKALPLETVAALATIVFDIHFTIDDISQYIEDNEEYRNHSMPQNEEEYRMQDMAWEKMNANIKNCYLMNFYEPDAACFVIGSKYGFIIREFYSDKDGEFDSVLEDTELIVELLEEFLYRKDRTKLDDHKRIIEQILDFGFDSVSWS